MYINDGINPFRRLVIGYGGLNYHPYLPIVGGTLTIQTPSGEIPDDRFDDFVGKKISRTNDVDYLKKLVDILNTAEENINSTDDIEDQEEKENDLERIENLKGKIGKRFYYLKNAPEIIPAIFPAILEGSLESNIEKAFKELKEKEKKSKHAINVNMGTAYEAYTEEKSNKPSYKNKIGENLKDIKYSEDPYSLYDAKFLNPDGSYTTIEDKNYYTFKYPKSYKPVIEHEGSYIPIKPVQNTYKNYLNDIEYNERKKEIDKILKIMRSGELDEIEKSDAEKEIEKLKKNTGVKIQLTKFQGYGENIPLFEKKNGKNILYGILNTDNNEFDKRNGEVLLKVHLKEGEYLYNMSEDPNLKSKDKIVYKGKEYFTLRPKKYITDGKNIYLPKSSLTKIL